jgi:HK97 family phage prohead protease
MEKNDTQVRQMERKANMAVLEWKEEGEKSDTLHIKAYALAFGNVDSWGDIIAHGAVDAFLASENKGRMALCYQHDIHEVIGVITDMGVDEKGMWFEADVLPTTTGKDVQTLIRGGAIKEFSIGYYADKYHFEKRDGYMNEIRILDEITIVEVSPVTRAANDKAVLIDAKAEEIEEKNEEDTINPLISDIMEQKMEMLQNEVKTSKEALEAAKAELKSAKETAEKQAQEINNLDASIKAQQAVIETMQKNMQEKKEMTFAENLKSALMENKDKIEKMFEEKRGGSSVRMEVKMTSVPSQAYGTAVDTVVGSQPHVARAFIAAFGEEIVAGDKAAWLDGTFTNNADYVEELVKAEDSDAAATEVIRQFGKIATRLLLSSELNDWMSEVAQWAQGEAIEFINDKVDAEVWNGAGAVGAPRKVYGLKGQATAFAKVGTYENATVADVILDAVAQAKKNGYTANVAIVPFGIEAELKGIKDVNGNYIYNQLTGMLAGVRILPSAAIGATEILVADSRCAKVLRRPSIEVEITRDADLDGWKVNVRKAVQTKVKAAHKLGLIYVADVTTAVAAIKKA